MKGKLIIIEGLDGSGKSTQIEQLANRAKQLGKAVRQIKFPNYAEDSSALVKAYLRGELGGLHEINAYAASVLYSVDRYATWRRHMHADYEAGCTFLLDRYTTANMYHQATKLPKEEWDSFLSWLEDLEYEKMGLPRPDLVLYLDMQPQTAKKLLALLPGSGAVRGRAQRLAGALLLRRRKAAAHPADCPDDLGAGVAAFKRIAGGERHVLCGTDE